MSATSPPRHDDTPSEGDAPDATSEAQKDPSAPESAGSTAGAEGRRPDAPGPGAPSEQDEPSIEDIIRGSIDDALARWDAAFGTAEIDNPQAEAEAERDLEGFDARQHLAAASTRAVNRYLAERGLSPEGREAPFLPTPAFLAEHGVPLMSVVFGAIEEAITSALTDVVDGRKPTQLESESRIQLDLSDLFGPEEP